MSLHMDAVAASLSLSLLLGQTDVYTSSRLGHVSMTIQAPGYSHGWVQTWDTGTRIIAPSVLSLLSSVHKPHLIWSQLTSGFYLEVLLHSLFRPMWNMLGECGSKDIIYIVSISVKVLIQKRSFFTSTHTNSIFSCSILLHLWWWACGLTVDGHCKKIKNLSNLTGK